MAEESDLEKTEPASSRRIEQAREEGNVPHSRELQAFLVLLAAVGGLWSLSDWVGHRALGIVRHGLTFNHDAAFGEHAMQNSMVALSTEAMWLAAPIFLLTIGAALAAPALIGGWVFSPKALSLNFTRLDPISGAKRLVSMQGLGELVKAIFKSLLIAGAMFWAIWHHADELFALISQPVEVGISAFFHLLFTTAVALLVGVAVIVAMDVPFQLWQYYSKLKMTREEQKQEHKEMEGDPQMKARIRSQQREMARKRMMSEVPKADVVVTNPTHFAVALKYDGNSMSAPQVVAKGTELIAQRIREIAAENNVPILEAPPLARALYRHAEIGQQIPTALYTAVAEVMAYIYQLGQFIADGGQSLLPPVLPQVIAVPEGLDPGAVE